MRVTLELAVCPAAFLNFTLVVAELPEVVIEPKEHVKPAKSVSNCDSACDLLIPSDS